MANAPFREIYDGLQEKPSMTLHEVAEAFTNGDVFEAKAVLDYLVGLDLVDVWTMARPEGVRRHWFVKDVK